MSPSEYASAAELLASEQLLKATNARLAGAFAIHRQGDLTGSGCHLFSCNGRWQGTL